MEHAGKSRRGDRDMISSLPDCLIHLIMSFLTAQQAVRTCVLSKRWKHLWTTLPFLDFDVLKFECDGESEGGDPQSNKLEKFRDFVSMTLLLREASDVHTFRLFCFGISHLPNCHMLFGPKMFLKMPSLTSAYICMDNIWWDGSKSCFKGKSNILIGFSNVQSLKLSGSKLKDLLENELSNCPEFSNLKDLSVDDLCLSCHFNLLASFLNRCPYLEKLSLKDAVYCESQMHGNQELLKIAPFNAKRLTTVEFKFYKRKKSFPQVVKYLQDITENSRAQISMTSKLLV
ncbi:F-box/RNI-like superfamily protein [Rhynchospora pubera]|uniref:F-box/RNI-like superfamily protein n=1 Tax=Rhynchospora pubera TaxID=906938 RepID=A0AAV8FFR2_9POAL|nr:F-box/RNI-like superfamily protein [Rhynchospora pubera]